MKRAAFITVHECPLASAEGKERGGINVYTFELGKALTRHGWQVDAFTRVQDDMYERDVAVNDMFRVIHLPNGPHGKLSKSDILKNLPEFTVALAERIRKEHLTYDVIHAHYYLSGLVARETNRILATNSPIVMSFHTLGLMKQLVQRSQDTEDPRERIGLERELTAQVDRILTSSETGKAYTASFYDADPDRITVIPPGVDTALFAPMEKQDARKRLELDSHDRLILAVGRIDPVKGFDVLLAAVKILMHTNPALARSICVAIVGGDVEQNQESWSKELIRLNALIKSLNLTATVQFIAPQPQTRLPLYYGASDVVVMPSHYESFGMVALEAIACGRPVIATDVTGISHVLKGLPQGHIISANNPLALADEIEHVLTVPHKPFDTHTTRAFDWGDIAKRVGNLYEELGNNMR